jgi:hypothetical protein
MKSELAKQLKEVLDNMSQEQFDKEWATITAHKFEGPSFAEAIEFFSVSVDKLGKFELVTEVHNNIEPTVNYLAA